MRVRVLQLGRQVIDHTPAEGATLQSVLHQVDITAHGMDVRVNGATAEPTAVLRDGDVVTVIPRIKGGCRPTT
jgi:sulfur carrier protein ThiS